ncbi:hypothetical protein PS914_04002 [Pseudomonas fluorescens]|nr:hypothetical protein PS914_04002 [Pseudomonas fluorescens]
MDANDNACSLNKRVALGTIASEGGLKPCSAHDDAFASKPAPTVQESRQIAQPAWNLERGRRSDMSPRAAAKAYRRNMATLLAAAARCCSCVSPETFSGFKS